MMCVLFFIFNILGIQIFFYVLIIKRAQNKAVLSFKRDLFLNESNNAYCLKLNITRGKILFNYL